MGRSVMRGLREVGGSGRGSEAVIDVKIDPLER